LHEEPVRARLAGDDGLPDRHRVRARALVVVRDVVALRADVASLLDALRTIVLAADHVPAGLAVRSVDLLRRRAAGDDDDEHADPNAHLNPPPRRHTSPSIRRMLLGPGGERDDESKRSTS